MGISGVARWKASERIAYELLVSQGFKVLEKHKKILINNTEVGEVDFIVEDRNGERYAAEVKAGKVDITGIRQAYVNALLLKMKPLIICKGYADDNAKELARELGVKVIQLSDIFLVESEELEIIVREVVEDVLINYLTYMISEPPQLTKEYEGIIEAILASPNPHEASRRLKTDVDALFKKIDELRRLGIVPRWAKKYTSIKNSLQLLKVKKELFGLMKELLCELRELREKM